SVALLDLVALRHWTADRVAVLTVARFVLAAADGIALLLDDRVVHRTVADLGVRLDFRPVADAVAHAGELALLGADRRPRVGARSEVRCGGSASGPQAEDGHDWPGPKLPTHGGASC